MLKHFDYHRPTSLKQAVELLSQPGAKLIAGGTDLIVSMRSSGKVPKAVVDIKCIEELKGISLLDGEIEIGAVTTINQLIESVEIRQRFPILVEAGKVLASHQVRNRATVAGNVCNASPAADMAPPLIVLNARAVVYGGNGRREIPLIDLFTGVKKTSLSNNEILTALRIPVKEGKGRYIKKARIKGPDLSTVGVACYREGQTLRVAAGACAPVPKAFEMDISGMKTQDVILQAKKSAGSMISPIDDVRASAEYRKALVEVCIERILREVLSDGEGEV